MRVFEGFFSVFFETFKIHNSNCQWVAAFRHPPYPLRKNQLLSERTDGRTNGRTNERTNERTWPNLTLSDVRSASCNKLDTPCKAGARSTPYIREGIQFIESFFLPLSNSFQRRINTSQTLRLSHVRSRHGGFADFGSILCPDTS